VNFTLTNAENSPILIYIIPNIYITLPMDKKSIEKRRYKRIDIELKCQVVSHDNNLAGITKNVSLHGIYVKLIPLSAESIKDFSYDDNLLVLCDLDEDNRVYLNGLVRWAHFFKDPSVGAVEGMGIEIKDPPVIYKDFINNLE
jgi:hypothetical protein